jgi:hypothetical protein
MTAIYDKVKNEFKQYLDTYFASVKGKQTIEQITMLVIIWSTQAYRAFQMGDLTAASEHAKEAKMWIDQFCERMDNPPLEGEKKE